MFPPSEAAKTLLKRCADACTPVRAQFHNNLSGLGEAPIPGTHQSNGLAGREGQDLSALKAETVLAGLAPPFDKSGLFFALGPLSFLEGPSPKAATLRT